MSLIPISIHLKDKTLINKGLLAKTLFSRMKGLLGTQKLEEGKALLIPDCRQVHTFFMNYPIDIIFLDSKNKILKIQTLSPWKISAWLSKAKKVIEVPEGFAKKKKLKIGDKLEVKENDPA